MTTENFRVLIERYERLVFTICYQLVNDFQEAQNLAQDTFVSAFSHIDTVSDENLKAWLARIATNKAKDYLKSAYNRRVSLTDDMSELDIIRSEATPESLYILEEQSDRARDAVQRLKEPYLKVATLFFLEEKTIEEISQQLDRPRKTVQTQIYRARSRLQEMLKEVSV